MATDLVHISFVFPPLLERYRQSYRKILLGMAEDIQTNRGLLFDAEGAYNGHEKWKDLANKANLKQTANGLKQRNILRKSGALRLSLSPTIPSGQPGQNGYVKIEGNLKQAIVKVGTTLAYAKINNEGGVINHPGTDNGFGRGIKIKPHPIHIPRRNFTDWNDQDAKNMRRFLKNLVDSLNGK